MLGSLVPPLETKPRCTMTPSPSHDQEQHPIPPVVYLPCAREPNGLGAEVELRTTTDGQLALLAYTALDRLANCCGPHQPWVLYPTDRLQDFAETQPFGVIMIDQEIPEPYRHRPAEMSQ